MASKSTWTTPTVGSSSMTARSSWLVLLARPSRTAATRSTPKSNAWSCNRADALERFFERSQVELVGPCAARLRVQLVVNICDRIRCEQAVFARLGHALRHRRPHALAVDAAVDHRMHDVHAAWPELARERLCERAQRGFGRSECS